MQPATELTPRSPRVRFPRDVRVVPIGGPPRAYRLRATNLSKEGVFLTMTRPLEEGTRVALSLEASGLVLPFAQGEVVRRQDPMMAVAAQENGVAVRFTDFLHPRAGEMVSYLVDTLQTGQPLQPAKPVPKWRRRVGAVAGIGALTLVTAAMVLGVALFWKDARRGKGAAVADEERAPAKVAAAGPVVGETKLEKEASAPTDSREASPSVAEAKLPLEPARDATAGGLPENDEVVAAAPADARPATSAESAGTSAVGSSETIEGSGRAGEAVEQRAKASAVGPTEAKARSGHDDRAVAAPAEDVAARSTVTSVEAHSAEGSGHTLEPASAEAPDVAERVTEATQAEAAQAQDMAARSKEPTAEPGHSDSVASEQARDIAAPTLQAAGEARPAPHDPSDSEPPSARAKAKSPTQAVAEETREAALALSANATKKVAAKPVDTQGVTSGPMKKSVAKATGTQDPAAATSKTVAGKPAEPSPKSESAPHSLALPSGAVTRLSWTAAKDQLRVEPKLLAGGSIEKVFLLAHPARLVFDVAGGAPKKSVTLKVGAGSLDRVRLGKQGSGTRIVIDLDQAPATLTQKDGAAVLKF